MAYEEGNLKEAERLLLRISESAEQLKEHVFAVNTTRVGLAAVQIGQGRLAEAKANIQRAISALEGAANPAEQELYGVTLRFSAQLLADSGEERDAENELKKSIKVLEHIGEDASVQLAYSLSDLAGLYATEGRFSEATQQIVRAMRLLMETVGVDDKEAKRAALIYNLCRAGETDLLDVAEASGIQLQYQFGANHPTMVRALKRYVTALKARGETARLEEAKRTFNAFDKAVEPPKRK
jgi:tetratricopeptide (TPR) repeat protein